MKTPGFRRLTADEQFTCGCIFDTYRKDTGREMDPWRRLGEAFSAMSQAVYLSPDRLAGCACVPLAAVQRLEDWHRGDREPRLSSIYAIGAYFGITQGDISDFIYEPVAVPLRGLAGMAFRLLIRCAAVAALGVGHRLHIVKAEAVAAKTAPLSLDSLTLFGLYSGQPSSVNHHLAMMSKCANGAY